MRRVMLFLCLILAIACGYLGYLKSHSLHLEPQWGQNKTLLPRSCGPGQVFLIQDVGFSQAFKSAQGIIVAHPHSSWTLLVFFDGNCPYCVASLPLLQALKGFTPALRMVLIPVQKNFMALPAVGEALQQHLKTEKLMHQLTVKTVPTFLLMRAQGPQSSVFCADEKMDLNLLRSFVLQQGMSA